MIDLHHDLLSIIHYSYLTNNYTFLMKWLKNFNGDNVSGLLANLYFMNPDEMREKIGNQKINVVEMFKISTDLFRKYLPNEKVIFSIEGCDYIESVDELEELYKLGLRNILLVWNNPNKYGSGNCGDYGLTELGREFLIKAIDLGISIDLSHMNKKTFYDTIELIKKQKKLGKNVKVIASHSNCYSICCHERNLDDDQIRKLKELDGILGIVGYDKFIRNVLDNRDLKDVYLDHIKNAVSIMGIDNVAISSDDMTFLKEFFNEDYGEMVFNYENISLEVTKLLEKEFSKEEIEKIKYKNIYDKLFKEVI